MGTITAWAAIFGAVVIGCVVAERTRRQLGTNPLVARRGWLLAALITQLLYLLGGQQTYGFGVFGALCLLPPLVFMRRRRFRVITYTSAALTGLVGVMSLLPFVVLGGPLLFAATCCLVAARERGSTVTPSREVPQEPRRALPSMVLLMTVANGIVLATAAAVTFGAARPG